MDAETYFVGNITFLIVYLAIAFFLLGFGLGWILWGRGRSQGAPSAWDTGHHATTIAPLLNPAGYSNTSFTSQSITPDQEVSGKSESQVSTADSEAPQAEPASADMSATRQGLGDDVSAGKARVDDSLGLVYSEPPEQEDDLTALKGVGKVLSGKLNDFGIYTYRQIAGWNESIINEFATRLSFKDRVQRDDWIGQAKTLHREKYGEDLD